MISPESERLLFERFEQSDSEALAALLADSSITRNITTNGSSAERCLASAHRRIEWHNGYWAETGYGVWALRAKSPDLAPAGRLLGWCGFVPPDDDDPDPEILYAIDRDFRGRGLASEAARESIDWLFRHTEYGGVTAVIFSRLNPGSVAVVSKLGLRYRRRMPFSVFLTDGALADEVAEYEIWRLGGDSTDDLEMLVEQTAFRAGQTSTVARTSPASIRERLAASLAQRVAGSPLEVELSRLAGLLQESFGRGAAEAYMDCYHLERETWLAAVQSCGTRESLPAERG